MTRKAIFPEARVRRQILDEEVGQVRELPYSLWRDMIGSPMTKTTTGRDGRNYRIVIESNWAQHGSNDIRVTLTSRPVGWSLTLPVRESFVISEAGRVST